MSGRKEHNEYNRLGFAKSKNIKGCNVAFCLTCKNTVNNTAVKRLEAHRRACPPKKSETDEVNDVIEFIESSIVNCNDTDDSSKMNISIINSSNLNSQTTKQNASNDLILDPSAGEMSSLPKRKNAEKGPPGRPKHEVWTLGFRRVLKHCDKTHRTIHAAYCVICSKVLCNTASKRLSAHRRICSFAENTEQEIEQTENADPCGPTEAKITKIIAPEGATTITFVDMDEASQFEQSVTESKAAEYTFIDGPGDLELMVPNNDHKLDIVLAKFFIGCNIPFSVADSPYFKRLCLTLNSSIKPVNSEQLAGPMLDTVYSKFHKDVKVGPSSVLMIDGWKVEGTNSKNVTAMIRTESHETIFLDNYELTSSKDVSIELTEIIKTCIVEAYEQFKTEVYAVILGDNCNSIHINNMDNVWLFPCNLQVVNMLIKDYVSQEFMNTICKILKQLNTMFKDEDLENKISTEMRWFNTKYILEYCMTNIVSIQTVLSEDNLVKLSKDYKCLFFDEEFIHKIESYINFLESINELNSLCQMAKANIADAVEQWLSIELPEDDSETIEKLVARRNSIMKIQCLVAYYLHPSYRGRKLTDEQMNKVDEFLLNELDSEGLNSLQAYVNGENIFKILNQKERLSAQTYWSLARRTNNDLASLALKLLAIPAAITSNFSEIFNTIKNNSLKPEKLRKLFAVYYYLKEKEERTEFE